MIKVAILDSEGEKGRIAGHLRTGEYKERIEKKYVEIKDPLPACLCFAGNMYLMTAEVFSILNNFLYGKPV